jgi:hypothetical protein
MKAKAGRPSDVIAFVFVPLMASRHNGVVIFFSPWSELAIVVSRQSLGECNGKRY